MAKKQPDVDWVGMGPMPYLGTCRRCGGTLPMPPTGIAVREFVAQIRAGLEAHRGCQEAGDGEDEAPVRRSQPAPAEGADEEAGRASPAASDGAAVAAGGVAR